MKRRKIFQYLFALLPLIGFSDLTLSSKESAMIEHAVQSIKLAERSCSKLNSNILKLHGMSSKKVRHFLNNICSLPQAVYLEIGMWKGSTIISALYKNEATILEAIGIDNWSEFGGPKNEFDANRKTFIPTSRLKIFDSDCFALPIDQVCSHPVNIYFYDGEHSFLSQQLAFTYYCDILDDVFIAIVDDWNWEQVRLGTMAAFEALNFTVLYEKALPANGNGDARGWWNGLYVAVIRKNNTEN